MMEDFCGGKTRFSEKKRNEKHVVKYELFYDKHLNNPAENETLCTITFLKLKE